MTLQNVTTGITTMNALEAVSPAVGWTITLAVFIAVIIMIFLLSKNIRQFFYGSVVSALILINYKFSRWVGISTVNNDFSPIKWVGYITGFIVISIIIGNLMQKIPFIKKLEKKLNEK